MSPALSYFFFFNDTATTEIYTLSLHDALPISIVPDETHRRPLNAGHGARLIAHLLYDGDDFVDFIARCAVPHDDQHTYGLPSPMVNRSPSFAAVTGPLKRFPAS